MSSAAKDRRANRLAGQTSPYLLQHVHNPVDWWPWGPEAFEEARRRGVPIFLSIGYSTCYWCHVMERESFESDAIAAMMNERFVCVKVDREERPDVDDVYMAAVQALSGRGGWPMSVFLEPHGLRPYWAGTYFPPEPRHGLPGFPQVLEGMSRAWERQREQVLEQAGAVAEAVREQLASRTPPRMVGETQVTQAVSALLAMFDRTNGGFGGAPKFPQPAYLELLLEVRPFAGDESTVGAIEAALRRTLDAMAIGGLHDQIGGGFHRYSVDAHWTVPHFEKMLYDNAQLASLYARASVDLNDPYYARVARRTLAYVVREMTGSHGAFFSAQDAEVNGREGLNYLWTPDEFREVLGEAEGAWAARVYGLDRGPNFRDPHHPEEPARNVPRMHARPEQIAKELGLGEAELWERLGRANAELYTARQRRPRPGTDDKVLAAWNGLMIAAMAEAGRILKDEEAVLAARRAADFVLGSMRDGEGGLLRSFRDGRAQIPAFLEDYAFVIRGLVALHRALSDAQGAADGRYLAEAARLESAAHGRFADAEGGCFDTLEGRGDLFVRTRAAYDGAIPSGSAAMLHAMLDLHEATGDAETLRRAGRLLVSLSGAIADNPIATASSTRALMRMLSLRAGDVREIFPAGTLEAEEPGRAGGESFAPVVVHASTDRIAVGPDRPAEVYLRLSIVPGYHINAADPGASEAAGSLVPLRVHTVGGRGVAAYADYPEGERYGAGGEIRVHRGEVEMRVAVERTGDEWGGRPTLAVTFQACTETECLPPMTVELDVAVDRL